MPQPAAPLVASPGAPLRRLKRLKAARSDLLAFTQHTFPGFEVGPHHRAVCDWLRNILKTRNRYNMLTMPPRHGKSELVSRRLAAWYLGLRPDDFVITAAYNSDLAGDFGYDVRDIIRSPEYQEVFPEIGVASDATARDDWQIAGHRGRYIAAGVGTSITGRGAHLFIIDDPFKDREDADSPTMQRRVYNWYRAVARTRLQPGGIIIIVNTRWNENDLTGKLMENAQQTDRIGQWNCLDLPALARDDDPLGREPGQALWPDWYPADVLEDIRLDVGERDWNSLYQQNPIVQGGDLFREDNFPRYTELPPAHTLRYYGASDFATKQGAGDNTVHGLWAVDPDGRCYLVDLYAAQVMSDVWVHHMVKWLKAYQITRWARERGQILNAVMPFMNEIFRRERVSCSWEDLSSVRDKEVRARSAQVMVERNQIYLPAHKPWVGDLLAELTAFPNGRMDDRVDMVSIFGRMIEKIRGGKRPPKPSDGIHQRTYTIAELLSKAKRRRMGARVQYDAPILGEHASVPDDLDEWSNKTILPNGGYDGIFAP